MVTTGASSGERALLDAGDHPDRADEVLVDRVDVVHVVLHLRDDAGELGDEAPEEPGLVHPPERRLGVFPRGQDVEEQRVGPRVLPQPGADPRQIAGDQLQRARVDVELARLGDAEQVDRLARFAGERAVIGDVEPSPLDAELVDRPAPQAEAGQVPPRLAPVLRLEGGAEDPRQVADILGGQEVVLHEALHPARARPVGVAEPVGDLGLEVEGEAFLGAAGEVMERTAHRPQEALGLGEALIFLRRQHAVRDELGYPLDPVQILADPEQGMEVAQPPLALLHVGLEEVARAAGAGMAGIPLGEFRLDEFETRARLDLVAEAPLELGERFRSAPQEAALEQAGAHGHVVARAAQAVVHRARGVADLQAEVPQRVQQKLGELFGDRGALVGQQEQQVDVRIRRELAAPVTADGGERQALASRRVGQRVQAAGGEVAQGRG